MLANLNLERAGRARKLTGAERPDPLYIASRDSNSGGSLLWLGAAHRDGAAGRVARQCRGRYRGHCRDGASHSRCRGSLRGRARGWGGILQITRALRLLNTGRQGTLHVHVLSQTILQRVKGAGSASREEWVDKQDAK